VLGYEMTIRFARAFGSGMTFKASSMSSHAYGPLFGAGYAAGLLMRFDENQFATLLNYLAQEASGLTTWRLDKAHTLKSYVFAGMPAMNGVKAAALVRSGFTGGGDALDMSDRNMLDAICPSPRPQALTDRLGEHFTILETDIKKYPIGYPIAAPVAALEKILAEHHPDPAKVEAIRIHYDEDWYKVVGDKTLMPDVNLRYCVAITVLDGRLTFDASHDADRMRRPDVVRMGRRIEFLGPTPGLERFAAEVEVDAAGRTFHAFQDRNVLGRYENPMTRAEVEDKALELMVTVLPEAQAREVIRICARIEEVRDVRELVQAMTLS
jgi:2-methylcitrate dehydratase PrpD